jgi:hypothetical protein
MVEVLRPTDVVRAEATRAWSHRVRRVGGFIQVGFAAFWLTRGGVLVPGPIGVIVTLACCAAVVCAVAYGLDATAGSGQRPLDPAARRVERDVSVATAIQLAASFVAPAVAANAGHPDWALPSIAITIGPLLLWLGHRLDIPRYRPVGWALLLGPVVASAVVSGNALGAATGLAAGTLLLATAVAGFHDLDRIAAAERRSSGSRAAGGSGAVRG